MLTLTARENTGFANRISNLSRTLNALKEGLENGSAKWNFSNEQGRQFRIFVAASRADRERAYRLAYRAYAGRGYVPEDCGEIIVSPADAQPETFTLLAEDEQGNAAGTITLVFDSEKGLPCDEIFQAELKGLRAEGRRLVEVTRLAIAEEAACGKALLVHLINFIFIYAKRVRGHSDFVIEVNPRHVNYYRKLLGFEIIGPERPCPRVQDAPAVLLRLDLDVYVREVRNVGCTDSKSAGRSLYPLFYPEHAEPQIAGILRNSHKPMSPADVHYFQAFVPENQEVQS